MFLLPGWSVMATYRILFPLGNLKVEDQWFEIQEPHDGVSSHYLPTFYQPSSLEEIGATLVGW